MFQVHAVWTVSTGNNVNFEECQLDAPNEFLKSHTEYKEKKNSQQVM